MLLSLVVSVGSLAALLSIFIATESAELSRTGASALALSAFNGSVTAP